MTPSAHTAWWLRLLVFHALGVAIVAGPGLAQLGPVPIGWVRTWQMFSGSSIGVCDVHYEAVHPDGTRVPIDRSALLYDGRSAWRLRPKERRVQQERIESVGRLLCRELPQSEVRVQARCATRTGWADTHDGSRDLCGRGAR